MVNTTACFTDCAGRAYGFRLGEFSHMYTPVLDHGQLSPNHSVPEYVYDDHRKTTFAGVRDMRVEFFVGDTNYLRMVCYESMSSLSIHSGPSCVYTF
jgi:hypothetical protein